MLNNPEVYKKLGVKLNDGLILSGEPGTGKTTMVRCLINSTGRKAYTCRKKASDGEFLKTIADTFEEAKNNTPSIVLLDDLDKFYEENEVNDAEEFAAVQACIDETKGQDVFVIATVNNVRKIPDSLLRAGRLGKRLKIRLPKKDEIIAIIRHYIEKPSKFEKLDADSIARMLMGESCATLESVINNAAIKASFNRQKKVQMQNIIDSCLDLIFESPEGVDQLPEEVRRKVAYHEAGHALVSELLDPGSVSIMSIRKNSEGDYGFVRYYRSDEKSESAEYEEIKIKASLSGKAAIELVFGEAAVGVVGDLQNAFEKAKRLVDNQCVYGFQNWIEDKYTTYVDENRNRTMAMLLEKNYLEAKKLLASHRDLLDKMAAELLEKTTLVRADVQRIMNESINEAV